MKKIKILILLLFALINAYGQIPDSESFTLRDVANAVSGTGAVAKVDLIEKGGDANDCTVSCNGHSATMTWTSNPNLTVTNFLAEHSNDFGAVTLAYYGYGQFSITANTAGVDFASAVISGDSNSAWNLVPNYSGSSITNLLDAFANASIPKFNRQYYPQYLVEGSQAFAQNSLLNFRDYGGSLRAPLGFACFRRSTTTLTWTWIDNSWDEDGFKIQKLIGGVWTDIETTGPNVTRWTDVNLASHTEYCYRIRSFKGSSYSSWEEGCMYTLAGVVTEWYLPSRAELMMMFQNLKLYGVGGFTATYYWSSTQSAYNTAWVVDFYGGAVYSSGKDNTYRVRAATNFTGGYGDYSLRSTGPNGGLIFYILYSNGIYTYFEAYPTDQSAGYIWSNVLHSVDTYPQLGSGLYNTTSIINQDGHYNSAAKLCNDL